MKYIFLPLIALLGLSAALVTPAQAQDYTYFVHQIQMDGDGDPNNDLDWDVSVDQEGSETSPLAINPFGARFELWAIRTNPLTDYLIDTTYVNSYIPVAEVVITSEDPYEVIPRTRADRPFSVSIVVSGLSVDPSAPDPAKSVKLLRHVQEYPQTGGKKNGKNIDRGLATLLSQGSLTDNGTHQLDYAVTSIPGANRARVRGEERFSVYSLADFQAPESQLDSSFIQVWPVAESTVTGITNGESIKGVAPDVSVRLINLYPDSWTYAQVYKGDPQLGTEGIIVPSSSYLLDRTTPRNKTINLRDWDNVIEEDGRWTMEIITRTPFGADRLSYVSFDVERTILINGAVTSVE
tara:strand:+ start:2078 stop:3130 length:1053 start_codon:yes stop_codon:yes gene_type:complete